VKQDSAITVLQSELHRLRDRLESERCSRWVAH
jgi:hypothetical protein